MFYLLALLYFSANFVNVSLLLSKHTTRGRGVSHCSTKFHPVFPPARDLVRVIQPSVLPPPTPLLPQNLGSNRALAAAERQLRTRTGIVQQVARSLSAAGARRSTGLRRLRQKLPKIFTEIISST